MEEIDYISKIDGQLIEAASAEITEKKQDIKYHTKDYTIEFLINKYEDGDYYIPLEYQRKFVWNLSNQCYFIESILMGLPIPLMFFADMDDGRTEIVDGAQRVQTLVAFANNDLTLTGLEELVKSNNFKYLDFESAIQKRYLNTAIRVVYLEQGTTISTRQEIFKRINTAGKKARPTEVRRGSFEGPFMEYLKKCSENSLFNKLAPRTADTEKRYEGIELVSRYFAYYDNWDDQYKKYDGRVQQYIDNYVKNMNKRFLKNPDLEDNYNAVFESMLKFIENNLELGFKKTPTSKSTPRTRFEALSVGTALALKEKPDMKSANYSWIDTPEFLTYTKSDAANNKSKLIRRITYVKDMILKSED